MRASLIVALFAGIAAALFFARKAAASSAPADAQSGPFDNVLSDVLSVVGPRGIRNNNPGNIRRTSTLWQGESATETDPVFEEFNSPEEGIRAMAIIIKSYRTRYGLQTLQQIISRWAPSNENDTQAYINAVSAYSGIAPDETITDSNMTDLIAGMIKQENGVQPYTLLQISNGVALA